MIQKRAVNMAAVRKHIEVSDIRMKDTLGRWEIFI